MIHTAFFGDGEKTFALSTPMVLELERRTGNGIGAIFARIRAHQFTLQDVTETIRLSLIGGGASPSDADALVKAYVDERPLVESMEIALDVITARMLGPIAADGKPVPQDKPRHTAKTGDLAAAISEADHAGD